MSSTLPEKQLQPQAPAPPGLESPKQTAAPARAGRFAVTPAAALVVAALSAVFCYFLFLPLWHTDLWGHLSYGRFIVNARALPPTEPLMPLSEGVKFVDTAWLSQVAGYATMRAFGVVGVQFLYAAGIALCLSLLAWRVWARSRSPWFVLLSMGVFLWVGWQHLVIVRPQLAGLGCFVALLVLLTGHRWSRAQWVAVPLLFVLWANLHGSFLVGLALLAAFCIGRGCDVLRRTDRFAAVAADRDFRRYLLLAELAAVAALLNPYGIGLYAEVASFAENPNLADIVEWEPLTLRMKHGQAAALVSLALVMLYRVTPRRVRVAEILLLAGLGGAALWTSRMIIWWAPVAAYFVALHGHAAWKRAARRAGGVSPLLRLTDPTSANARDNQSADATGSPWRAPHVLWTGVSVAIIALAVALKFNEQTVRGPRADLAASRVSTGTPVAAVAHLREFPPFGQLFNSYEWGDYLLWAGPPGVPVFVASHAHLVPREVWQSYMQVMNLSTGWEETLAHFGANTVLIEKQRRRSLVEQLREDDQWQITFEDELAVVFRRITPIGAP